MWLNNRNWSAKIQEGECLSSWPGHGKKSQEKSMNWDYFSHIILAVLLIFIHYSFTFSCLFYCSVSEGYTTFTWPRLTPPLESVPRALCSIKTSFTQSEQLWSSKEIAVWLFGLFVYLFMFLYQSSFSQREDTGKYFLGWKGRRVAFVAQRVDTTLKGDRRVKGHFKPLQSGEPASEDYMEHWLLKYWRCVGRKYLLLSWVIGNLASVRNIWVEFSPFTQTWGKMLVSLCTS